MEKRYRSALITDDTYNAISYLKEYYRKSTEQKIGFNDVLEQVLVSKARFLRLDKNIRDYLAAFVSEAASYTRILGIMLFGSVAKGTYAAYSDIDVFIITDGSTDTTYKIVSGIIENLEPLRKKLLIKNGLHLYLAPLIERASAVKDAKTIYFDIVDYGIPLFERFSTLENFIAETKKMGYRRTKTSFGEAIEWK